LKKINLYIPKAEDLWFRQACMQDPDTMKYNSGYDVSYKGYHYDTGCIDFPKDEWQSWLDKKLNDNSSFYAYIQDDESKNFVGHLNYHRIDDGRYMMGIVIHSKFQGQGYMRPAMTKFIKIAKQNGVNKLYDSLPKSREKALKVFYDLGFVVTREFDSIKFGKSDPCVEIMLNLTK
jgi:diamine N-acetyltransferase